MHLATTISPSLNSASLNRRPAPAPPPAEEGKSQIGGAATASLQLPGSNRWHLSCSSRTTDAQYCTGTARVSRSHRPLLHSVLSVSRDSLSPSRVSVCVCVPVRLIHHQSTTSPPPLLHQCPRRHAVSPSRHRSRYVSHSLSPFLPSYHRFCPVHSSLLTTTTTTCSSHSRVTVMYCILLPAPTQSALPLSLTLPLPPVAITGRW